MGSDVKYLVSSERPRILRFTNSAGPVRSKFLLGLRDSKKMLGTRCPGCARVHVPARPVCTNCFCEMNDWVEVENKGTLLTYSAVHQSQLSHRKLVPFAFGIVQLDGADTGFLHYLGDVEPGKVTVGMRVEAVFAENREGSILDIKYFRPVSD